MNKQLIIAICFLLSAYQTVWGQSGNIIGRVTEKSTKQPVKGATVIIEGYQRWAVTDNEGKFTVSNIPYGKVVITVSCLGYSTRLFETGVEKETQSLEIALEENSLALEEITVLARRKADDATTSYVIDRTAIEHMQILSINDIGALLPGGQINRSVNLISAQYFNLRRGLGSEMGSSGSGFGTAVEVDGVRLSNNSSMTSFSTGVAYGVDVRGIGTSNIESVEIITGVPSVEYGDLSNGVVKVNTTKGRTPYTVDFVMKPHTKQYSISKGFDLGRSAGILNTTFERVKSISDLASPYTAYERNILALNYSKTFNRNSRSPLKLNAGITGNLGGYDSSADPDLYKDTYSKRSANSVRVNIAMDWQLNRKWITGIEASAAVNYLNNNGEESSYKSSSGYTVALHGTEEKYYSAGGDPEVVLIPPGTWYQIMYADSRQVTFSATAKGIWARRFGLLNNRIMAGAEFTADGNEGRGVYYEDIALAPTWREQRYRDLPYFKNLAVYAEERVSIPFGGTALHLTAGLRSEWMMTKGSIYGTVNSLSPRFNLKYDIPLRDGFVKDITIRAGYGKAVKLPSFSVLYPLPAYSDLIVFNPLYAYYTYPLSAIYNPDLRWQHDKLLEIGVDASIGGVKASLSFFYNKTVDRYEHQSVYTPVTYYYTAVPNNTTFPIPADDRNYDIDPSTGVVTVTDKTGAHPPRELPQTAMNIYRSAASRTNASPVNRKGVEWIFDFGKVEAISTSFRLDGKYYVYKGIDETLYAASYSELPTGPHPFIGYYVGSTNGTSNGSLSKNLNLNLTVATHIPKARLIFSLRIESTLYRTTRNLSEYKGKTYAFAMDSRDSYHPSGMLNNIYAGNVFVGAYPLCYSTHEDPGTLIPFAEAFKRARDDDRELYNILATMVRRTNYNYMFNKSRVSPYYSASIAVTKEIGKIASLTFNANNFFNNTSKVRSTWTDTESTLYGSSYIPAMYYGLSLKLKF